MRAEMSEATEQRYSAASRYSVTANSDGAASSKGFARSAGNGLSSTVSAPNVRNHQILKENCAVSIPTY